MNTYSIIKHQTISVHLFIFIIKIIQILNYKFNISYNDIIEISLYHTIYLILNLPTILIANTNSKALKLTIITTQIIFSIIQIFLSIASFKYWTSTGSYLDAGILLFGLENLKENWFIIKHESSPLLIILAIIASIAIPLSTIIYSRKRTIDKKTLSKRECIGIISLALLSTTVFYHVKPSGDLSYAISYPTPVYFLYTYIATPDKNQQTEQVEKINLKNLSQYKLIKTNPSTDKLNVFVFIFESTNVFNTSLHSENKNITPNLLKLSQNSYIFSQARATVPHTSRALASIFCGIEPYMSQGSNDISIPGLYPVCLPHILKELDYKSAHFQMPSQFFENRADLIYNIGFSDFFSIERFNEKNTEKLGYLAYDDMALIIPIKNWISKNKDKPLMLSVLTSVSHHDYILPTSEKTKNYSINDKKNKYMNSINYVDKFLGKFIQTLKEEGVYENSLIIILGDHGDALGEHGTYAHDNSIYDEVLRIPFIIHTSALESSREILELTYQYDILPTILNLLGYKIKSSYITGRDLFTSNPAPVNFQSCWFDYHCASMISNDGVKKIYNFEKQPNEAFNILTDPKELIKTKPDSTLDIVEHYTKNRNFYKKIIAELIVERTTINTYTNDIKINKNIGSIIDIVSYKIEQTPPYEGGQTLRIDLLYEIKSPMEKGWELMIWCDECEPFKEKFIYQPLKGYAPASSWHKGQQIRDQLTIVLPRSDTPRTTTLYMGIEHESKGHLSVEGLKMVDGMAPILSIDALPSSY